MSDFQVLLAKAFTTLSTIILIGWIDLAILDSSMTRILAFIGMKLILRYHAALARYWGLLTMTFSEILPSSIFSFSEQCNVIFFFFLASVQLLLLQVTMRA